MLCGGPETAVGQVNDVEEQEDSREERQGESMRFICGQCDSVFNNQIEFYTHRRGCHPDCLPNAEQLCEDFHCETCSLAPVLTALEGMYRSVMVTPSEQTTFRHQITFQQH